MKKISAFLFVILIFSFCACSPIERNAPVVTQTAESEKTVKETTESTVSTPIADVTTVEDISADIPGVIVSDFSKVIEAEEGIAEGNIYLRQNRDDYSGVGYMTGFDGSSENSLEVSVMIPTNQHYNITIVVASDAKMNNILTVNGEDVGEFITSGSGKFESITLRNVYIYKGLKSVGIKEVTGGIDVDYVYIHNSSDIENIDINPQSTLINENADDKTVNTMNYLVENFGKKILSGQYATPGTNTEPDLIYKTTGHYPALRLSDLASYTSEFEIDEVEQAINWSKRGGIVSYVWHWEAPLSEPSYYKDETDFDVSKAVTQEDISGMSIQEIEKLYEDGKVSEECLAIVRDIDIISKQLLYLQDNGVTVLWRPLHEASGGWFWWGSAGVGTYKWLWNLMYERQTNYHKLNNLIWVWNAQNTDWYVGDDKCDIISADVYSLKGIQISQVNTYVQLSKITNKKLIALSECSNLPVPDDMFRDKATWSWFGLWSGNCIMDSNGELSENYNTKDQIIKTYSHENTITLEQLPDLRVTEE